PTPLTWKRGGVCGAADATRRAATPRTVTLLRMADILRADGGPDRAIRKSERLPRRRLDRAAVARRLWRQVAAAAHHHRIDEMLVQVIDELGDAVVHARRHRQKVPHRQVLHQFAEPDAARVRADRDSELRRHQDDGEILVHAAQAAAVDLAEADGAGLQELFEEHAVGAVLAGGDADWRHRPRDRRMAEHVVRAGRLLDPPQVEAGQRAHALDRFADVPALVGVDHQAAVGADRLAHEPDAPRVVGGIAADLHLEVREAFRDPLAAQAGHL